MRGSVPRVTYDVETGAVTAAWDRLVTAYAAARPDGELAPYWSELVVTATGAALEQVDEEVQGYAPHPSGPRAVDDVVVEVLNGVSDVVVRVCADVVLYGDETEPAALVAEARRLNDRYCDLYDLVSGRHPDAGLGEDGGDRAQEPAAPAMTTSRANAAAAAPAVTSTEPAPWLHRTGAAVDSRALGELVRRLVRAYAEQGDAATLEALWRSAFAAASGCTGEVVQEVCEGARLPGDKLSEERAANEVAAGFEDLFGAAVVRLFAADGNGDERLAEEARRLVRRRDALFDLVEDLYPGMYEAD